MQRFPDSSTMNLSFTSVFICSLFFTTVTATVTTPGLTSSTGASVVKDTSVTLTCACKNSVSCPGEFTFKKKDKGGTVTEAKAKSSDATFTFTASTVEEATYQCINTIGGTDSAAAEFALKVTPKAPTITKSPTAVQIEKGSTGVKLTCTPDKAVASLQFTFYEDDSTNLQGPSTETEYTFTSAKVAASGAEKTYKCEVTENSIVSDKSVGVKMQVVDGPPSPVITCTPEVPTDGGSVTVQCTSGAKAVTKYAFIQGSTTSSFDKEPEVKISPLAISAAGISFECKGLASDGSEVVKTTKTLKLKPQQPTLSIPGDQKKGTYVTLECKTVSTASGLKYTFVYKEGGNEIYRTTEQDERSNKLKIYIKDNKERSYKCLVIVNTIESSESTVKKVKGTGTGGKCDYIDCGDNKNTDEPCKEDAQGNPVCQCKDTHEGTWCEHTKPTDICSAAAGKLVSCRGDSSGVCDDKKESCVTCPGFYGRFCENKAPDVDATCSKIGDCVHTKCTPDTHSGYCKFPEYQCKCRDFGNAACTSNNDCHAAAKCSKQFGLCESKKCRCFDDANQMIAYMVYTNQQISG